MSNVLKMVFFASVVLSSEWLIGQGPPPRTPYESKCGSEIAWHTEFDAALAAARETGKPIFWFVPTGHSTPMDRIQELYWLMMGGMFSDGDVIHFIQKRFVPLNLGFKSPIPKARGERRQGAADGLKSLAEKYGLTRGKFIEPGVVLLDKSGELIHVMDRLTTHQTRYFLNRMMTLIRRYPALDWQDQAAPGAKAGDQAALAEHLLIRGEWAAAKTIAEQMNPADNESARVLIARANVLLGLPGDLPPFESISGRLFAARRLLAQGHLLEAREHFEKLAGEARGEQKCEAVFFLGVCRHLRRETQSGDAAWTSIRGENSRYGWKARLELERWGPFYLGFEEFRDYPPEVYAADPLTGTTHPGSEESRNSMIRRAVSVLLALQRENGSWDDSRYDFGGTDSLPNVHMAVTALAAWSLLEWRSADPERIDAALDAADRFLADEKNTNPKDVDELAWAHVYRLFYWQAALESGRGGDATKSKVRDVTHRLQEFQQSSGAWRHEYENPFTTASVLVVLHRLEKAGFKINAEKVKAGAALLKKSRAEDGTYSYGFSRRGGAGAAIEGAAGRMPLCELALLECGLSSQDALARAIEASFTHHHHLEGVRKYDNHADQFGNGGFFFWYDMMGRALAIRACIGEKQDEYRRQLRKTILDIHEADGAWMDSHELGKSYGTASGLISLKLTETPGN